MRIKGVSLWIEIWTILMRFKKKKSPIELEWFMLSIQLIRLRMVSWSKPAVLLAWNPSWFYGPFSNFLYFQDNFTIFFTWRLIIIPCFICILFDMEDLYNTGPVLFSCGGTQKELLLI